MDRDEVEELGLSPRVRGNPFGSASVRLSRRSIPACAGEPRSAPGTFPIRGVYPRVCGGTRQSGGLAVGLTHVWARRSIPACAGEPPLASRAQSGSTVYPRVCGGTRPVRPCAPFLRGLSPRVRGNQERNPPAGAPQRSIPACAGEPFAFAVLSDRCLSPRCNPPNIGSIPACAGEPP